MIFSHLKADELQMLGTVVIYRAPTKQTQEFVPAMVTAYNAKEGLADLLLVGSNYFVKGVAYDEKLDKKSVWCFKKDIIRAISPSQDKEILPPSVEEPVEEPSPQGAASEGSQAIRGPSEDPQQQAPPA